MEYYYIVPVFCNIEYLPGRKTCDEAHIDEHLLTDAPEEILANWVKVQGHHGIPLTYESVAQFAGVILGHEVGE